MATRKPKSRPRAAGGRRLLLPLLLFLASFLPVLAAYYCLFAPMSLPYGGYHLAIERGKSLTQIVDAMAADGVLPSALALRLWLKLHPHDSKVRPGVYLVLGPMTPLELLQKLDSLEPVNRLRVIEGSRFSELLANLAQHSELQQELGGKSDSEIMAALGLRETYPEGLFAPDTYDVAPGDTDTAILRRLYLHQQKILNGEWAERAPGLPYRNPYEALIMASIIEKETGTAAERPIIAGVFVRRLQARMRLQTDPTVIYGLGPGFAGHLSRADLLNPTPYNTYVIDGLPPTPIALPGQAAIHAALHPSDGNVFYFVAKGDGTHQFSATLAEQTKAVQAYQMHRVDGYHSAPAKRPESP